MSSDSGEVEAVYNPGAAERAGFAEGTNSSWVETPAHATHNGEERIQTKGIKKCHDEYTKSFKGTAYWKYKEIRYALSEDLLCQKRDPHIYVCMCDSITGHWIPDLLECKLIKNENVGQCPDKLFEIQSLRKIRVFFKISTNHQASNEEFCNGSNVLIPMHLTSTEISIVAEYLIKNISVYWLPTRRNNAWKKVFNKNVTQFQMRSDAHCLKHILYKQITLNSKNMVVTEDCNTFLNAVCIFQSELLPECPNSYNTLVYRPNVCYDIDWKKMAFEQVNVKKYLKKPNWLRKCIAKYVIRKKQKVFLEMYHFSDTFGDNYSILIYPFQNEKLFGEGMKWVPALAKQTIEQRTSDKMVLKMDGNYKALVLVANNQKYLWVDKHFGAKCFIYLKYDNLKKAKAILVLENKKQSFSIFHVKLDSSYGSDGHIIFDFQLVSTQQFIAPITSQCHGFVIRWNVSCIYQHFPKTLSNPSSKGFIVIGKKLRRQKKRRTNEDILGELFVHDVQIMSMERITNMFRVYWIHLAASLRISKVKDVGHDNKSDNLKIPINIYQLKHIQISLKKLFMDLSKNSESFIRCTDYCFPERIFTKTKKKNEWIKACCKKTETTRRLRIKNNGMHFTRLCQGEFLREDSRSEFKKTVVRKTEITKILHDFEKSNMLNLCPEKVLSNVRNIIIKNEKILVPADILSISNIIQDTLKIILSKETLRNTSEGYVKWRNIFADILNIYNSINVVDSNVIRMSAKLNSTNKLLESFERSIDFISTMLFLNETNIGEEDIGLDLESEIIDYDDIGVSVHISKFFLYFLINPTIANVSGIALFKNNKSVEVHQKLKGSFRNEHYRFLQTDHDINDVVKEPGIQIGVYLSKELLGRLKAFPCFLSSSTNKSDPIIVIKVYSNDKLFQPSTESKKLLSHIVSISLPGYNTILPEPLPLILRIRSKNEVNMSGSCQYWNYEYWDTDGILTQSHLETKESIVLCLLKHLTPTAYFIENIISTERSTEITEEQFYEDIMVITIIICFLLALIGLKCCIAMARHLTGVH
ncbi:uncharacterized protein [Drosophila takahashii]|uniref:uncharacterized protein n=1 Tax=Drosophila takahashii TaxID=29030 RepID=UPI00389923A4